MSFVDFAHRHGVLIDYAKLYASDKIKRCGTVDKPRSDNGAYFWDGERGWVMNWSNGSNVIWYQDKNAKPWTDEDKKAWMDKRRESAKAQEQKYEQTAQKALEILKTAKLQEHQYLEYKGLPEEKGLVIGDKLYVPMRNVVTNKIQGFQTIFWDASERRYDKKMLPGMRAKDAVLFLGDKNSGEYWLVEGFVTGLSLRNALKSVGVPATVVVCFSANNLVNVADKIKGAKFVFADNDQSKVGEESAKKTGLPWVMADEVGWDANDLHYHKGLFAVISKVMQCRNS